MSSFLDSAIMDDAQNLIISRPMLADAVYKLMRAKKSINTSFGLTARQAALLDFIHEYHDKHGIPPSFDEMREASGLRSKSGIFRILTALEERGHISRLPNRARSITLEGTR